VQAARLLGEDLGKPLLAQAGSGYFDDSGFPAGKGSTILSTRRIPVGSALSSISKARNLTTLSVKDFKYWRI